MDSFTSLQISATGMSAERTRMSLISSNLANANTTHTPEGGPYRRKDAIFTSEPVAESFEGRLEAARRSNPASVDILEVREDQSPPRQVYDPGHPDANSDGYVLLPNVNVVEEMTDMIAASRAYEANVTAAQAAKSMALKTLELAR
ncbi:MAG TPA: flagellar basal body rod protein FlgC [Geobacterales bacterium]|nr:flagellar basal body rod protein FlgC [Geobacterales bacterium]